MPDGVQVEEMDETYGRFVVQPLERGYGVTIGNAFRRVLLSSLSGTAITAVRVDGVQHEFSTIRDAAEGSRRQFPYIEVDRARLTGKFLDYPQREDIPEQIREQLIVELYSK